MDPLTTNWSPEQVEVMHRLRDWIVAYNELNQHLAGWTGLPTSDANALGQIIWADEARRPLSPADVARQLGMTSGATTVLLNRLESAGHIRRSREQADRRRVTLRPEPDARDAARAFLSEAGAEVAQVLKASSTSELQVVAAFLGRLTEASVQGTARLRGRPVRESGRAAGNQPIARVRD